MVLENDVDFENFLKAPVCTFLLLWPFAIQTQAMTWSSAALNCHYWFQLLSHVNRDRM